LVTPILPPNGRVIAYVVGLESYVRTSGIKAVDYARRDVEAFAEVLQVAFPGRTVEVMMRIDEEATLTSLRNELPYNIASLHEDDLFVFYYAGHGFYGEGGNRLTAYDSNAVNLEETTWLLRELLTDPLARSPCKRALVFIDACAKKLEAPGRSIVRPIDRKELDALATARFHAVFLSCEAGQTSYGSAELQHGIWTHFLLKALRGEAIEALGTGRMLTGAGLQDYLRREVSAFAAKEEPGRVQQPYALIGSSGTFAIRIVPEGWVPPTETSRPNVPHAKDLVAIGPNVVAVGEMLGSNGSLWTIGIDQFVIGDWRALAGFVDDFDNVGPRHRYILLNALGEGRAIAGRPAWKKNGTGAIDFFCDVAPPAGRIVVDQLPSMMAISPATGDVFAERGAIARTSGQASLQQMLRSVMSLVRGESYWDLDEGAQFSDYLASFTESPWLERLFKLEAIRLASVARIPALSKDDKPTTPLRCVDRVRDLVLLDRTPRDRRVRVALELDLHGGGTWSGEVSVLILDEEALRDRRATMAAQNRIIQPALLVPEPVEARPVTLPPGALRSIQKPKR
jgi:hypothetical protein